MESNQLTMMSQASTKEIAYLTELRKTLTKKEFKKLTVKTLNRFILNSEVVSKVDDLGSLAFEVSVILMMENKSWYSESILFLTSSFRQLMLQDRVKCVSIIEEYYADIHDSLACWHDAFVLQDHLNSKNPRILTRACFKMLGDSIESVHSSFVTFIYQVCINDTKSPLHMRPQHVNFGKAVDELIVYDKLEYLYKTLLHGISLSQWRNIAQHSSYKYNDKIKKIECTYGSKHPKSIKISIDELLEILETLNLVHSIHKTSVDFFLIEFMHEYSFKNMGEIELSIETILGQMGNTIGLNDFNILSAQNILGTWNFKLEHTTGKGVTELKEMMPSISMYLSMLRDRGIWTSFELFDVQGTKLTECHLGKNNFQ
jgi:hypothetical protein